MLQFFQDVLSGERATILNLIAGYFFICGIYGLLYWQHVRSWPHTSGTLIKSEIGKLGNSMRADEQRYLAKQRYQYSVGGEDYEGKRLSPIQILASVNMRALLHWQMRYITYLDKDKTKVAVFFNPKKPQKSYLIRPLRAEPFIYAGFVILPIIFWLS